MQKTITSMTSLRLCLIAMLLIPFSATAADGVDCLIEPNMVVDVSSAVEGVVERFHVERSDFVEQGQLLLELESGVEIAAVNKARARAQMEGALNSQRSSLEFNERRLNRVRQLYKKGLVSSFEMDEAETQVELARAELQKAEDEQKLAILELQRAEETLNLRRIRSPFKGVVVERFKSPGESVEDKPIIKLAQLDPLRVEVYMSASEFGKIKPGLYARVTPENAASEEYLTEAKLVDRVIDAASGTFTVRLELPNPDQKIPSGLRCKVSFLSESESAEIHAQQVKVSKPAQQGSIVSEDKLKDVSQNMLADPAIEVAVAYENRFNDEPQQIDVEPVSQCWSVGPITDKALLTRLRDRLEPVVSRLSSSETTEISQTRFLILSPPQASLSDAKALLQQLQQKGVKDVAVLYKGQYKNRISFGLYKKEFLAQQHLDMLESKQIKAEIHPRQTTVQNYWLALEHHNTDMDEATLNQMLEEQQPGIQLTQTNCQDELIAKTSF
ncbi:MAG: efflux RND transporter periplasmic adaptor subunit [Gammaproteobacteria bacterium]